jgi:hypothetical protein
MNALAPLRTLLTAALVLPTLTLTGCPGAQVRGDAGDVNVVLRRIDVVEADYDRMRLHVIVAIENRGGADVPVSADASIAMVGEAPPDEEGAAEEAADGEEAQRAGADPVDGQRHAGRGAGKAAAYNTSELPIVIEVPLPADPALLEQMLDWKKMLVHVEGVVKVGADARAIGGHREIAPPHLPEVKLKEAQVASVDGGAAGTGFFTLLLDNKNPFAVKIDRLAFTVTIKDKELKPSSGTTEAENDSIPASAVGEYQAEVQIDEAAFGKELKALLKNPTVPYVIEGAIEVRGIKRAFRFAGDMKFAR